MISRGYRGATLGALLAGSACALAAGIVWIGRAPERLEASTETPGPQCAHWSVLRCCELLGAQVEMPTILKLLSYREGGHNMLELAEVLGKIGFDTEGRRETFETMATGGFPCIAHLEDPDHFIVISGVERDRIHLFDGRGRRTTRPANAFQSHWSGKVLYVRREPSGGPLPAFAPQASQPGPRIQFDTLFVDKGDVPATGEPVPFVYPFRNVGDVDLVIGEIHPSCKCIKAEKPEGPVPPTGEGTIRLFYYVEARGGSFYHNALLETNDLRAPLVKLKAAGNANTGVTVVPRRLDLGRVVAGRPKVGVCFVNYSGDWEGFAVEKVTSTLEGAEFTSYSTEDLDRARRWWPDARGDVSVSPGTRVVELSFDPPMRVSGKIERRIHIHTSVEGYERISLPVVARVIGPVRVLPGVLSFGEVLPEEKVQKTVTLLAMVDQPFRIVAVEPNNSDLQCTFPTSRVNGQAEIQFVANGSAAIKLAGTTVQIRVGLVDAGQECALSLPLSAWKRGDPEDR